MEANYQAKATLMLYGLHHDFFAYGTIVTKLASGKYKVVVDGEVYYYTLHDLANEWDQIDLDDKIQIATYWAEEVK